MSDTEEEKKGSLPIARVKRIMKVNDEVNHIGGEAAIAVAKAAELFLEHLARSSFKRTKVEGRKTVQVIDMVNAVQSRKSLDFLPPLFVRHKKKHQETKHHESKHESKSPKKHSHSSKDTPKKEDEKTKKRKKPSLTIAPVKEEFITAQTAIPLTPPKKKTSKLRKTVNKVKEELIKESDLEEYQAALRKYHQVLNSRDWKIPGMLSIPQEPATLSQHLRFDKLRTDSLDLLNRPSAHHGTFYASYAPSTDPQFAIVRKDSSTSQSSASGSTRADNLAASGVFMMSLSAPQQPANTVKVNNPTPPLVSSTTVPSTSTPTSTVSSAGLFSHLSSAAAVYNNGNGNTAVAKPVAATPTEHRLESDEQLPHNEEDV
eukprot:GILJ01004616.1.p1 GENE.GILJ01004616.1~~GILJ01004616.1.p1  ORF type:complete len:373 (+),score=61.45 GILJ01004616.1:65-1183(+)